MTNQEIESEIKAVDADVAPRVTLADIEAAIQTEYYFTAGQGVNGAMAAEQGVADCYEKSLDLVTFCVIVLRNGYRVGGVNACVSAENWKPELARKYARENAINQCWPLFGFALAEQIYRST